MKKIDGRLAITWIALAIGLCQLTPWKDQPYDTYLCHHVQKNQEAFQSALQKAKQLIAEKSLPIGCKHL